MNNERIRLFFYHADCNLNMLSATVGASFRPKYKRRLKFLSAAKTFIHQR